MFYLANKLALELWYVSFCANRLGEIRGRGEFLCFEIVSDQLACISISIPGTKLWGEVFLVFELLFLITHLTFLLFDLTLVQVILTMTI